MTISKGSYVPILKWRQGEYQALLHLSTTTKEKIVPLIVIPPIEYDFEEEKLKKTIQEHIEPFANRFQQKWGNRFALLDFHSSIRLETMNSGEKVPEYVFSELRKKNCTAIPVTALERDRSYQRSIKAVVSKDANGCCLRLTISQAMSTNVNSQIQALFKTIGVSEHEVDLVLDLEEPDNFEPYAVFTKLVLAAICRIQNLDIFRSFVLSGMSLKLNEIKKPGGQVPRHEWLLYKSLLNSIGSLRVPSYSDYTIETPKFVSLDMRKLRPAGKIAYTCDQSWLVPKGDMFRGNENQMIDHCNTIVSSGQYSGPSFSYGDKRIDETSRKISNCGNLSTWKQVGVNHHIETAVSQLAILHVP